MNDSQQHLENISDYLCLKINIESLLSSSQLAEIDKALLYHTSKIRKKTAMVIVNTLVHLAKKNQDILSLLDENPAMFLAQRIRYLVEHQLLIAYGDTRAIRFSEISKV